MRPQPGSVILRALEVSRGARERGNMSDEILAETMLRDLRAEGWHFISEAEECSIVEEPPVGRTNTLYFGGVFPGDRKLSVRLHLDSEILEETTIIAARVRAQARDHGLEHHMRQKLGYELARRVGEKLGLIPSAPAATVSARP